MYYVLCIIDMQPIGFGNSTLIIENVCHNKNDKSKPIQEVLNRSNIYVRQIKVCGVNTEYCVKDTVHGLTKKFHIPIKVIEKACNGTDRTIEEALHKMRTFYRNVEVL